MDFLITLAIFICILFLYIYITNQYKKGEDLEIYEMDYSNNAYLQEVCEIRQPVIFRFDTIHPKLFSEMEIPKISKYYSYDVCIKDAHDYYKDGRIENSHIDSVQLSFQNTVKLFEKDQAKHFFSENNSEFLEECNLVKSLSSCDDFFKPHFTIYSHYDLMFGSPGAVTPLRYHTNYRQILCVTSGKIQVKMAPWKSNKYLHPIKDYDNYEFRSPVHAHHPKEEFAVDYEKTKFLDFSVEQGNVLVIPPYWFYSIEYDDKPGTYLCQFIYNSAMNCLSNIGDLGLHWLQRQNITKKITKISPELLQDPVLETKPTEPVIQQDFPNTPIKISEGTNDKQMVIQEDKTSSESSILTMNTDKNIEEKEKEKREKEIEKIEKKEEKEIAEEVLKEVIDKVVKD